MKKTLVILTLLALLLAGGLWLIQRQLDARLARAMPEASRRTGLPLQARHLEVDLLRGSGALEGFTVGNPAGFPGSLFELAEGRVTVRYWPLLAGRVELGELRVREARLTIIRLADGRINVRRAKGTPAGGGGGPREPPPEPRPDRPLPAVGVGRLEAGLDLVYRDYALARGGEPFEAVFRLNVTADDLRTYGAVGEESTWAPLEARGVVESGGRKAPVVLSGRIAPLTQPAKPSFRLSGRFDEIDPELIRPLLGNSGVTGDPERLDLELFAREGRFDETQSRLTLSLRNVKYGNTTLPSLTLVFPVDGTVDKPKLRVEQALLGLLSQILSAPPKDGEWRKKKGGLDVEAISKGLESLFKKK